VLYHWIVPRFRQIFMELTASWRRVVDERKCAITIYVAQDGHRGHPLEFKAMCEAQDGPRTTHLGRGIA
jgi:hypothetical protein